jgi:4'-phosphopantetheinyl transferase
MFRVKHSVAIAIFSKGKRLSPAAEIMDLANVRTDQGEIAIDLSLRRWDDEDIDAWADPLTLEERARAERFRQSDDRRRYILGRSLLRTMLGRRLDRAPGSLIFGANAHGKPTLADADGLAFNVSHSGDYVLVAVGDAAAIGVDVEQWRPDLALMDVGRRVFTAAELALIRDAPEAEKAFRFFRQWTFKEAVAKACGLGLSLDLRRFEVAFADHAPRLLSHGAWALGAASDWRLEAIPVGEGYCGALAVRPWETRS